MIKKLLKGVLALPMHCSVL